MSTGDWLCLFAFTALLAAACWAASLWLGGQSAPEAASPVVINRVMSSNPSACFSVAGRYYDWIELLNTSAEAVSLKGWRLSDDVDQRGAFAFGDVALPGRGSLIVYCAPRPEGYDGGEIFCGFGISANGETLALSDARRRFVQVLGVPAMAASDVYQRGGDGRYAVIPFDQMVEGGAVDLRPAWNPDGVVINELMASNRTQLQDSDGDWSDWLELYNGASEPVDLSGCALSDDDVNQRKWVLPALTMRPGEYLLIFASGKDRREGELHANFKLSTSGEAVRLYDAAGNVLSWVEYPPLAAETSLSRLPDGTMTDGLRPTPGYENSEAGVRAALTLARENPGGVVINEIFSAGEGEDWVELYNASGKSADLSGMGLSDSTDRPRKWLFPDGAILPAGGYMLVTLTGRDGAEGIQNGRFCANFALTAGETATLCKPDGTLVDRVTLFDRHRDVSYGRAEGQARYRYFAEPTPGAKNAERSYAGKASQVEFSQAGGQHGEKSLTVALSSDPDVTIYYTTDGTNPTAASKRYDGEIRLEKNAVIKAVAWREDVIPSDLAVRSFLLNAAHTVRVVSVSGRRSQLNGSSGMLKTGVKGEGSEAYVEVYDPDGTQRLGQRCLMKLAGHSTRVEEKQKGFSLRAKKQFGHGKFEAALFSNRDYDWYKSFVMRASGQDCRQTFMRDSVLSALAADTGVLYRETEVCVVYVNGEYWGVYNMRERVSSEMMAQFHGWDNPDDVEIVEGTGVSSASYMQLLGWVRKHDLSSDANVAQLRGMMDIENYLEYVALQLYVNNQDLNNVAAYRNPGADNLWRWVLFDLDLSFQLDGDNVRAWLEGSDVGTITAQSNVLFRRLMKNDALRDWFLTRMGRLLATTFSAGNVTQRIRERYELLEPEMKAECRRWEWSVDVWKNHVKKLVRYAQNRPEKLIGYLKKDFRLSDAQVQRYFGEALANLG